MSANSKRLKTGLVQILDTLIARSQFTRNLDKADKKRPFYMKMAVALYFRLFGFWTNLVLEHFFNVGTPVGSILSLFVSSTYISAYKLYAGIITNRAATISNVQVFLLCHEK